MKDFYSYLYFRPERNEMIELVTRDWTQDELIELAGCFGHWFEPGADWSYSSTNYFLLGVVIERATGLALHEAYRTYVFDPLGIEDTWLTWHEPAAATPAITGYMGPVDAWEHSAMFGELGATTGDGAPPDLSDGYGLGLLSIRRRDYPVIGHGGLFTGHTAGLWYLPGCAVTVAIYLNRGFVGQRYALDRIVAGLVALGGPFSTCADGPAFPTAPDDRRP